MMFVTDHYLNFVKLNLGSLDKHLSQYFDLIILLGTLDYSANSKIL